MSSSLRQLVVWLALTLTVAALTLYAGQRGWLDTPRDLISNVVAPMQGRASQVGEAMSGVTGGWTDVRPLRDENARLRDQVDDLVRENIRLRASDLENRELREQLHYAEANPGFSLVGAQIIGFDQSAITGYATIDRGGDAGVEDGMPVLATAGLAGRVVSHTRRTSSVLLITHPSSSVNAYILGMVGATGVVNGMPDGRLLLRYLPPSERVTPGSVVVTSGLGGAFPRNLPIGRVAQVESREVDMFQQAIVEPLVDIRRLLTVLVARGFVPIKN